MSVKDPNLHMSFYCGCGSDKMMRIHSDPDPQHWCNLFVKAFFIFMFVVNVIQKQYVSLSTFLSFYGIFVTSILHKVVYL